jgi:Peptidase C13 family
MIRAALLGIAIVAASAGAAAAQQGPDPFNGQFGVIEVPPPPQEAIHDEALMSAALDGLQPQRPGHVDTYVLAAALWGDPVFEREASQGAAILASHFGAEGRTIILSAGGELGERRYPAATPTHLFAAIGRIGQLIDPDEDLVVVFLTSHGSPDGTIALRENNRLQASMRPVHLREALQSAGVRNKLVIVSSCFSGAFIAPLMNPQTVVLTASAPDRSSFGCQADRDWTFFGDAFFNQSVRSGGSLLAAFDHSKTLISQWESARNFTPSNPQRFVGARGAAVVAAAEQEAEHPQ